MQYYELPDFDLHASLKYYNTDLNVLLYVASTWSMIELHSKFPPKRCIYSVLKLISTSTKCSQYYQFVTFKWQHLSSVISRHFHPFPPSALCWSDFAWFHPEWFISYFPLSSITVIPDFLLSKCALSPRFWLSPVWPRIITDLSIDTHYLAFK